MVARSRAGYAALAIGAALAGCSGPPEDDRVAPPAPSYDLFRPAVSDVLEAHCGTLDCHGSLARNLRIYGIYGTRLDPREVTGLSPTTEEEYAATYEAVISLQPEVLADVLADAGARAERLVLVTKSRGSEVHVGGKRLPKGSDGDRCLVSWLGGGLDVAACQNAAGILPPGGETW